MSRYDFRTPRLFVAPTLDQGVSVPLDKGQSNYLTNVLRLEPGDSVLVFNGQDGEWRAELQRDGRKSMALALVEQMRPQHGACDLHYLFAPLKHARLDYMVQKAVELGVSRLQPVITRHTQAARVNVERMQANAIEAAEQCGILTIADTADAIPLPKALDGLAGGRVLIFCDEDADTRDPVAALSHIPRRRFCRGGACAVVETSECGPACARSTHPACRHGGGRGADAGSGGGGGLAVADDLQPDKRPRNPGPPLPHVAWLMRARASQYAPRTLAAG
jgi:16S rRNA (uracil1498-N3)-methyltransferase